MDWFTQLKNISPTELKWGQLGWQTGAMRCDPTLARSANSSLTYDWQTRAHRPGPAPPHTQGSTNWMIKCHQGDICILLRKRVSLFTSPTKYLWGSVNQQLWGFTQQHKLEACTTCVLTDQPTANIWSHWSNQKPLDWIPRYKQALPDSWCGVCVCMCVCVCVLEFFCCCVCVRVRAHAWHKLAWNWVG